MPPILLSRFALALIASCIMTSAFILLMPGNACSADFRESAAMIRCAEEADGPD
jgi:hypothetical protein